MEAILGLEFNDDKIKLLELLATDQGLEASVLSQISLPAGSVKEGIVAEPKLVAAKIEDFLKEEKISTRKVITLINPGFTFSRIVRLPSNLSDEQIHLNLEAELDQYRAFMGKDAIISYNKLEEINEEGIKKTNILFSAVFKTASKSYLDTCEAAGLDLVDIDVPILCLLRALDETDMLSSTLDVTLLMLIGDKQLDMCILKGNRPRFLHSVEIDTLDFDKDKSAFTERLLSMVKLVVNFYQARFVQGEEIARIVLNPLNAKYNQLHILLQEKLPHIPIQLSRPLNNIYINKERHVDLDLLKFPYSCLLGAALRIQNKSGAYNLNLLFKEKTQRQNRQTQIYIASVVLSAILAITLIMFGVIFLKMYILRVKVAHFALKLKQRPQDFAHAIAIKERIDSLRKHSEEAQTVLSGLKQTGYFKNIAHAVMLVPSDLWLTDVALDKNSGILTITGASLTEKPIFDYISSLSGSGYFSSVELTSSKGQEKEITFNIQCAIK